MVKLEITFTLNSRRIWSGSLKIFIRIQDREYQSHRTKGSDRNCRYDYRFILPPFQYSWVTEWVTYNLEELSQSHQLMLLYDSVLKPRSNWSTQSFIIRRLVKDFSSDCSVHYSRENPHFESTKENIKTALRPNVWALYGIVSKWEGLPSFEVWNLLHGFHVPDFIWEKCRTLWYKTILLFDMNDRILGPRLIIYAYQLFRNIGTNHRGGQNVMKQKTQKIFFLVGFQSLEWPKIYEWNY